ncbi:MAG TPA: ABC transporter permease, partial [Thermoanaerobaculia bacterium]|nr:ABC transporter permease [Thermoanaerobaculia bacterium]
MSESLLAAAPPAARRPRRPPASEPRLSVAARLLLPLGCTLLALLAWQLLVMVSRTQVFPLPGEVARGIGELLRKGILWRYIGDSLRRVSLGYGLAALLGIGLGLPLGRSATLDRLINPLIQMLRPISPLAWMPLAIIWFGVSDLAPIFLIFLAAFFPIVVATANAVRTIPPVYFRAASNFALPRAALLRRVLLPAIVPRVLTGLRVALGIAWMVVVAAEMLGVDSGLGYLILDSRNAG